MITSSKTNGKVILTSSLPQESRIIAVIVLNKGANETPMFDSDFKMFELSPFHYISKTVY